MELNFPTSPSCSLQECQRRDVLQIVYRRPDGDYSIIELGTSL